MSETPSSLERAAARNLVKNYLRIKPDENVIVEAWDHTLSMSSAMVDEVRRVGGSAFLAYENDNAWWRAVERKQAKLLGRLSDPEWAALKAADVYVQFWGPADSARLQRLPEKVVYDDWGDGWFHRWYKMARSNGLRGGRMALGWVTDTRVHHWGANKERWRRALLEACLVDPQETAKSGKRLARALTGKKKVRITHDNGTDLEVALAGVPGRVYEGYPHPNDERYSEFDMMASFPDGTLRIALDAQTAEGRIVSNLRSYDETWFPWRIYSGGEFEFSGGKLTSFSLKEGRDQFNKSYARATAGKDRTGSLSIGLNPKLKNVPYLEDRERGSLRFIVGENSYMGGSNPSDFKGILCLAGSEISVEGTPIVRAGKIL
jgi:leucyl aminopeptidase (aminopeptidase T)